MPLNFFSGLECATPHAARSTVPDDRLDAFDWLQGRVATSGFDGEVPDAFTVARALAADKGDAEAAWKRLQATMKWREEVAADSVLDNPPAALALHEKLRVRRILGIGRQGQVFVAERCAEFLASDNFRALPTEDWVRCHVYFMEQMAVQFQKASQAQGQPVARMAFIGDASGMSLTATFRGLPLLQHITELADKHFPGILDRKFLNPAVAEKVHFFPGVPTDLLLTMMEPEQLPSDFGGTGAALPHTIVWSPQHGPFVKDTVPASATRPQDTVEEDTMADRGSDASSLRRRPRFVTARESPPSDQGPVDEGLLSWIAQGATSLATNLASLWAEPTAEEPSCSIAPGPESAPGRRRRGSSTSLEPRRARFVTADQGWDWTAEVAGEHSRLTAIRSIAAGLLQLLLFLMVVSSFIHQPQAIAQFSAMPRAMPMGLPL